MRIAFVVGIFPAISETFILNQITGLMDLGHEVDIYAGRSGGQDNKLHLDVKRYGLAARTGYFGRSSRNPAKQVSRALRALGATWKQDPGLALRAIKNSALGLSLEPISITRPLAGSPPYDIVQCHFGPNGYRGVLMKQLGLADKVVVTFHAYELTRNFNQKRANSYKWLSQQADLLTPISEHWQKRLVSLGCREDRVLVHRMGIDLDRFEFQNREPRQTLRLLLVARLVEKKGVRYAIEALSHLKQSNSRRLPLLSIIGDGELRDELETLVAQQGLKENVRFLGWMSQEEVQRQMTEADVFLLPSVTSSSGDQEGIPVSLMEAMASGMPVVSTWHSGIPELVTDGVSGCLVPERDPVALSERLSFLIDHPDLWSEMGHAGRRHVDEHYNIQKLNRRLANLYESLLAGRPSGVPDPSIARTD